MRIAYIEPFSGTSGNMLLGALFDAGLDPAELVGALAGLHIPDIEIVVNRTSHHGIGGTHADVKPEVGHHSRSWRDIREMLRAADLPEQDKTRAIEIYGNLAEAEATVHGEPIDDVHFHEVGALDTTVDIVGFVVGMRMLGIERIHAAPVHVGGGTVRAAHGVMPVPAPATALLLARFGVPIAAPMDGEEQAGELLTPTGAAILGTLASFTRPAFVPDVVGTGFGTKQLPWPNMTRITIGQTHSTEEARVTEDLIMLQTNIDDMNPQFFELLTERLFDEGALDVWTSSIQMKKNRRGQCVSVLARPADQGALVSVLIEQSTTLGVRVTACKRIAAERSFEIAATRWGDVQLKLKIWNGRVLDVAPEYDDCVRLARSNDIGIREVWNEAHRIGEVYVGRRVDPQDNLIRMDPLD